MMIPLTECFLTVGAEPDCILSWQCLSLGIGIVGILVKADVCNAINRCL